MIIRLDKIAKINFVWGRPAYFHACLLVLLTTDMTLSPPNHLNPKNVWNMTGLSKTYDIQDRSSIPNWNKKAQLTQELRATAPSFQDDRQPPSWIYRTGNSAIRSADPENSYMEWIGCTVCEIFAFKLYCDLETGVRGHSRSSKVALFGRAHTTLYSSFIVTMPLYSTLSEIKPHIGWKLLPCTLVFGAPFMGEAVRYTQRPLVTKN